MTDIVRRVESEVAQVLLKAKIGSVLVAVSGGADSVALLTACCRIAKRLMLRVEVVNCNFHLRGEESNRDSEFTARLCNSIAVKLHSLDYDMKEYVKEHRGVSIEMACREMRYSDFYRIMAEGSLDRVAVAHNADDDIETMMLNMLRGSGSRGLRGMEPDNGRVIRPLLGVSRKEIEIYLDCLGVKYVTDSSNLTSEYRRNFIRREVLPLLESRWPGARKSLSKTVGILKEESLIIENYYHSQLERLSPDLETLLVYADGVTSGTILRFVEPFGGNSYIAEEILKALDKDFNARRWNLSERYHAVLERDCLKIIDSQKESDDPEFKWSRMKMTLTMMAAVKGNRNHDTVYLPYGQTDYIIRKPQKGDRIAPLGMRGTRLVSDVINDAKLDRNAKSKIRVLARKSDGEIIWVSGLKRSRHDLVQADTETCYKLESTHR